MTTTAAGQQRPEPDELLVTIAQYVLRDDVGSAEALSTARYCLLDSLGCGLLALEYPRCTAMLGPVVPGAVLPGGARVPGTSFELDPIKAAFDIGAMIRWLDFNDTWLAAEWGHPSDNLGAILAVMDYCNRQRSTGYTVADLLQAMIKAHEIQGVLALENAFNRVGLDHVLLVRIASTAVATRLLGGNFEQIINALSNAWIDGGALRTYRHAPNTGSRKSWAAGDAASRAVRLALIACNGEMGYPSALTAPRWGFQDALFGGQPIRLAQPLDCYVMENVLFKIAFPAEFHAQTAIEAAFTLHPIVKDRLNEIDRIELSTQESAVRIIDKTGPLYNPADRDHCLQYMVAIGLIFGELTADHYEDEVARDPRIDELRAKMTVKEDPIYTVDYLDPAKRSIANAVQVFFKDGTSTDKVEVHYPLGHRRRRAEAIPLLLEKFRTNASPRLSASRCEEILHLFQNPATLDSLTVDELMGLLARDDS